MILTTDGMVGPSGVKYDIQIGETTITRWALHVATMSEMVVSYERARYRRLPGRAVGRVGPDWAFRRYRPPSGSRTRYTFGEEIVLCPNKHIIPDSALRPHRLRRKVHITRGLVARCDIWIYLDVARNPISHLRTNMADRLGDFR